jgi:predicted molibdopterin-dependent oxidoreductase YjgC
LRISDHPIIDFPKGREVEFTFEGEQLTGIEGEPIAAALHAAGVRLLRVTPGGRPRGLFCAIGNCSSCYVVVDGVANVRSCTEPLREGMAVRRQEGHGELH